MVKRNVHMGKVGNRPASRVEGIFITRMATQETIGLVTWWLFVPNAIAKSKQERTLTRLGTISGHLDSLSCLTMLIALVVCTSGHAVLMTSGSTMTSSMIAKGAGHLKESSNLN